MLHPLDDHPVHQTPEPLAHPGTSDRNFYDRYFFNGYGRDGSWMFGAALGLYPNRAIQDAAFSVVRGGEQWSVHASREARTREATRVGPIAVEVIEPMRALRLVVAPNPHGLAADLVFRARTVAVEEPRFTRREGGRLLMDATRFTQFGTWSGHVEVGDERIEVVPERTWGSRDRSWGIRPIGERAPGPMLAPPQFFWLWAPLHFDDLCTHFDVNEDARGERWHQNGVVVPVGLDAAASPVDASGVRAMRDVVHRIDWEPGTRRAARAEIGFAGPGGARETIALEPLLTFQMAGIGYLHPTWGHGTWHGPEAVGGDHWRLAEVDPLAPHFVHVQQLCRARLGNRDGIGVLEQLALGPHAPSGFAGLLDGAPAPSS